MADFLNDFEWHRDSKGYRLERLFPPWKGMPLLRYEKPLAGYDPSAKPIWVVQRNGGKLLSYRPLAEVDTLYSVFASIKTRDDVLHFIEKFGSLTEGGAELGCGDSVPIILEQAEMFRDWLSAQRGNRKRFVSRINKSLTPINEGLTASLVADAQGEVHVRLTPLDLLGALWLQLALKVAGKETIRACLHCGHWFEAGAGSGRRLDAKFCSDAHRIEFNSRKRTRGA
jgi:hypothetical protein